MRRNHRLIVALDTSSIDIAIEIVELIRYYVWGFKIGYQLSNAIIGSIIHARTDEQAHKNTDRIRKFFSLFEGNIFWDAKFADIPNTVENGTKEVATLGPTMLTVHASSGIRSLKAAVNAAYEAYTRPGTRAQRLKIIAVSVLTSLDDTDSDGIFGAPRNEKVLQFAMNAAHAKADGIVCAAGDISSLKGYYETSGLLCVVPGVRPEWAAGAGDHSSVVTPAAAIAAGANYVVIGRPITAPPPEIGSPLDAIELISGEMGTSEPWNGAC